MEGDPAASEKTTRPSQTLCAGEQEYVHQRKQVVLESLNSLGIKCTADSVPHIAMLGSGGGQRAAVSLVGSLYQMEKEGLLDSLLYLGGISGSTWSMSSLYSDPQWSTNMDKAVSRLLESEVERGEALAWLGERAKEEHFSLTDVWGVLASAYIMKQMDLRRLSDEASRNASNPYPIYCAIEKHAPTEGKWFELSPHEAGFTELGVFVETSLLGSKFQGGELLEKKPEMDMVKLRGVLGSALADVHVIMDYLRHWLHDAVEEEFLRVCDILQKLIALMRSTRKDPPALMELDKLQNILEDKKNQIESALWLAKSSEERRSLSQHWSWELLKVFKEILFLIMKWEWGTTENFLYQDAVVPPYISSKDRIHLIDAGLLMNVPYPSFLGDKRDIDLIIAPEYSAGNMFETLTLARDYAAEVNKPFPEIGDITLEDRDWPKDCYVFEGKEKEPTIVYMPLFNRQNCKDAEEFKSKMEEFSTFRLPFSQKEIEFLLETAKANIRNNKETLLREMDKAAVRRHKRLSAGRGGKCQNSESCPSGLV